MGLKKRIKELRARILGRDLSVLDELIWGQVYTSTIADSEWLVNKSVSPGRWAVGYNYLYVLYRALDEVRPKHILELGLGQSTKVIGQYAAYMNAIAPQETSHLIIEQDASWAEFFLAKQQAYVKSSELLILPVEEQCADGCTYETYRGFADTIKAKQIVFNLISVDAPIGGQGRYGRRDILSILPDCLSDDFVILFDDYGFEMVEHSVVEAEQLLAKCGIRFAGAVYSGAGHKKIYVIASEKWKFLTTL
ncbi:hypothetical protein TAMA11512_03060 [Selenomonas sp. TAMA-11512]|uniref:hypothetical protein n=1 Tax=Selenomonas sp. TAMA-11512 TaxID=3095337 RepID=UPI003090D229|nr:hypothetical protein TAMA11512_03060 [Selenomonas sp. TAMA-11512]